MATINTVLVEHVKAARAEQAQAEKTIKSLTEHAEAQKRIAEAGYEALSSEEKAILDGKKVEAPPPKK